VYCSKLEKVVARFQNPDAELPDASGGMYSRTNATADAVEALYGN